jgi:hypothetical protein
MSMEKMKKGKDEKGDGYIYGADCCLLPRGLFSASRTDRSGKVIFLVHPSPMIC